jgi:hypothetical protein
MSTCRKTEFPMIIMRLSIVGTEDPNLKVLSREMDPVEIRLIR